MSIRKLGSSNLKTGRKSHDPGANAPKITTEVNPWKKQCNCFIGGVSFNPYAAGC